MAAFFIVGASMNKRAGKHSLGKQRGHHFAAF